MKKPKDGRNSETSWRLMLKVTEKLFYKGEKNGEEEKIKFQEHVIAVGGTVRETLQRQGRRGLQSLLSTEAGMTELRRPAFLAVSSRNANVRFRSVGKLLTLEVTAAYRGLGGVTFMLMFETEAWRTVSCRQWCFCAMERTSRFTSRCTSTCCEK